MAVLLIVTSGNTPSSLTTGFAHLRPARLVTVTNGTCTSSDGVPTLTATLTNRAPGEAVVAITVYFGSGSVGGEAILQPGVATRVRYFATANDPAGCGPVTVDLVQQLPVYRPAPGAPPVPVPDTVPLQDSPYDLPTPSAPVLVVPPVAPAAAVGTKTP